MDENSLKEAEKKNKKIALITSISLCAICMIFGIVGGITKFVSFVDETSDITEENMRTEEEQEFKDGVLNIKNGGQVVGSYKCEHTTCGYVYGYIDDNLYDLKTIDVVNDYQIRKIINNRFVLLYDDDAAVESLHRDGGVKVYDYVDNKVVKEYTGIKNYNRNDMSVFIAKDANNKWGVIKFDKNEIVDMVNFEYDYIGVYVPTGEQLNSQTFYAGLKNEDWVLINISDGSVYSKEFTDPIIAYDGEMVVTKRDNTFRAYDTKGNLLFKDAIDYNFCGAGLLTINSSFDVRIFDTYAISSLFEKNYVQIGSVSAVEEPDKIIIKVNDEDVYTKPDKKKSERNTNGADFSLIVNE